MKPKRKRERERDILTRYLYSSYTIMLVYVHKARSEQNTSTKFFCSTVDLGSLKLVSTRNENYLFVTNIVV